MGSCRGYVWMSIAQTILYLSISESIVVIGDVLNSTEL